MESEGGGGEEVEERGDNDGVGGGGGGGEGGDAGGGGGGEGEEGGGEVEGGGGGVEGVKGEGTEGEGEKGGGGSSIGEGVKVNKGEERETDSAQLTVAEGKCDREETPLEMKEELAEERKVDGTNNRKEEGEAGDGREGEEGGNLEEKEKKAYKDQLLKSAGIQLQGSLEDNTTGAPLKTGEDTTQDRNLEQFSEILLDSDVSPTDSETGLSPPEGGEGEGGTSKPERRVRFADEVLEATDNAGLQEL